MPEDPESRLPERRARPLRLPNKQSTQTYSQQLAAGRGAGPKPSWTLRADIVHRQPVASLACFSQSWDEQADNFQSNARERVSTHHDIDYQSHNAGMYACMLKDPIPVAAHTAFVISEYRRSQSAYHRLITGLVVQNTRNTTPLLYRLEVVSFQSHSVASYSELELSSRRYPSSSSKLDRSTDLAMRDMRSGEAVSWRSTVTCSYGGGAVGSW